MSAINDALKKAKEESQKNQTLKITKSLDSARIEAPKKEVHTPQKRKVILLAVLSFILLCILALPILFPKINKIATLSSAPNNETASVKELIASKVEMLKSVPEEKPKVRQPIEAAPAPSSVPSPPSDIILNGIMYSAKNPVAVINDELITEGEKIGGVKVIEIRRDSVDVEKDGSLITLSLKKK